MNRFEREWWIIYTNAHDPQGRTEPAVNLEFVGPDHNTLWAAWFYGARPRRDGELWIDFPHVRGRNGRQVVFYSSAQNGPTIELCRASFREFNFDREVEPFLDWVMETCPEFTNIITEILSYVPPETV